MKIAEKLGQQLAAGREAQIDEMVANMKLACTLMGIACPSDRYLRELAADELAKDLKELLRRKVEWVLRKL